jgi:hypothetical protein
MCICSEFFTWMGDIQGTVERSHYCFRQVQKGVDCSEILSWIGGIQGTVEPSTRYLVKSSQSLVVINLCRTRYAKYILDIITH